MSMTNIFVSEAVIFNHTLTYIGMVGMVILSLLYGLCSCLVDGLYHQILVRDV